MGTTKDVRGAAGAEPGVDPRRPGGHQRQERGRGGGAHRHGCQRRLPAADRGDGRMSAGPAPGAAGDRDGPGPVAAVRRPWLTRNVAVLCVVPAGHRQRAALPDPAGLPHRGAGRPRRRGRHRGGRRRRCRRAGEGGRRAPRRPHRAPADRRRLRAGRGGQGAHRPGLRVAAGTGGPGHRPDRQGRSRRAPGLAARGRDRWPLPGCGVRAAPGRGHRRRGRRAAARPGAV